MSGFSRLPVNPWKISTFVLAAALAAVISRDVVPVSYTHLDVYKRQVPDTSSCPPLNRFTNNLCSSLPASWYCGVSPNTGLNEANEIIKTASTGGGVLCCRD